MRVPASRERYEMARTALQIRGALGRLSPVFMRVPTIPHNLSGPGRDQTSLQIGHVLVAEVRTGVCTVSHESHASHT
jgi:hypothetical protein